MTTSIQTLELGNKAHNKCPNLFNDQRESFQAQEKMDYKHPCRVGDHSVISISWLLPDLRQYPYWPLVISAAQCINEKYCSYYHHPSCIVSTGYKCHKNKKKNKYSIVPYNKQIKLIFYDIWVYIAYDCHCHTWVIYFLITDMHIVSAILSLFESMDQHEI